MAEGVALLEGEVRELIRRRGLDPGRDHGDVQNLIRDAVADYDDRSLQGLVPRLDDLDAAVKSVRDAIVGLGALQQHLDDPEVEEVWINAPGKVFVARHGRPELTTTMLTEEQVHELVERMLRSSGRRLDLSTPFVDATLPTGERVHVVIPDVTRRHWAVNIRKFLVRSRSLADLVALGSLTEAAAAFLHAAVASGLNILVSGATQSGKTTLVNSLAGSIPAHEHVVTCEEVFELQLHCRDWVAMQCRQPNLEGTGEIPLRRLVKESLRMRPDRLIIGEVREAEALDMLIALNAGIPGACTVHANSARDAVVKMTTLPLLAGENVSAQFVVPTVAAAFDLVVHLDLHADGHRQVAEIVALSGRVEGGVVELSPLYARTGGDLARTGGFPPHPERFDRAGFPLQDLLARS